MSTVSELIASPWPGTESTSNVCSALTSTLRGKLRTRATAERDGSRRFTLTRCCLMLNSETSVVKSLVTSTTTLLSFGLKAAMSKLATMGGMFDRSTARATGLVLSARMSNSTMRRNTLLPRRSHFTTWSETSSPAKRTPCAAPRWAATIRNSLPNIACGIS